MYLYLLVVGREWAQSWPPSQQRCLVQ